jgi:hypothetical protein
MEHGGIFVIESLPARDRHTGSRLFDHVAPMCGQRAHCFGRPNLHCRLEQPRTAQEFREVVQKVASGGWIPILHIEAHGCEQGIETGSGELVLWGDLYADLQSLNIACRNNLMLVMSACHGIHAAELFLGGLLKAAPVRCVIGPETEIYDTDLESGFIAFYTEIIQRNDCSAAGKQLRAHVPSMKLLAAETLFALGMNKYFEEHGTRKEIEGRVDAMLSQVRRAHPDANMTMLRRRAKWKIRNMDFDRYKDHFFMIDKFPELAELFRHVTCSR